VTSVGRLPRSDIFLDDVTVSRRHVELRWEKDDFHVTSPGHSAANSVKFRDRRHKAPKKKPSLSQHRFWHHCGDGCAFGAGSQ
jgi:pSer/pThr/pTyr-binding forkhead associated (FHA) protein